MRNLYITFLLAILSFSVFGSEWINIRSQQPVPAKTELVSSNITSSTIHISLDGFYVNPVKTPKGDEYVITIGNATPVLAKGAPDLPKITTSLIIPDADIMDVEVLTSSYTEYKDFSIAPSKGNLTRDIDPSTVPYEYGRPYSENSYFPDRQAELRDPYILRDFRGQTVVVYPFAYNPVTGTLRVYTDITLRVYSKGQNGINTLNRSRLPERIDNDFMAIYNRRFLNNANTDYTPIGEYGKMLVICYGSFMSAMQPFVDWKNQMGIPTEMVDVATIGSTSAAIKTYVTNYFNTNGLTFLLLVGDAAQIPTNTSGSLAGPSDNAYGYILGNDHYPDIIVGRFSAETVEHVNTMVQRTLEYEKNPDISIDWFSKGIGIGSDQGPGDDGEYDYQHIRNIRTDLMGFTYTAVAELYDGSQGGEDQPGNPTPTMVASFLNPGTGIINYCGHGSDQSWGTTGFSNSNINQLSNNHMWPFIFSVACVNGNFPGGTCFAEAWLRAKNTTGPTGAIATLMSTINQSWNPPMEGQDEMDDILVESYPNNIKRTFGGISMNGCCKMNDTYGSGGNEMTDTWTVFGDPSVNVITAMPQPITAVHDQQVFIGASELVVNADVDGGLVALSLNNQLLASGIISGGTITLQYPAISSIDTLLLVITGFNRMPYITEIPVVPNTGPYLVYVSHSVNDATFNGNGIPEYGETVNISLALKNIGILGAENLQVTLMSDDQYITITDPTENYPLIPAGETATLTDAFAVSLASNIPDQHVVYLHYTAVSDTLTWTGNFSLTAHAGIMAIASYAVDDPSGNNNGKIDPGETFDLIIQVVNNGSAAINDATGQLSFNDPMMLLLSSPIQSIGSIPAGESVYVTYTLQADPESPAGHIVPCVFGMQANYGLTSNITFPLVIGQIPVAILDLDKNHNSGPVILNSLLANNIFAEYLTSFPSDISGYYTMFVCLGTGTKKYVLSSAQGQSLANVLNVGGKIYMEGGDTWYYDPKTAVHNLLMINGVVDGSNDLNTEVGQSGTLAEGMTFAFQGDNEFIDHITPVSPAQTIFKNNSPLYNTAISYSGVVYKSIGSSFEFGGLADGNFPSTKNEYMRRIISFFGLSASPLNANFIAQPYNICDGGAVDFHDFSTGGATSWQWTFPGGNPASSTEQNPTVVYDSPGNYDVMLVVGNGTTTDTISKAGYINVEYCTGVTGNRSPEVSIYPNPAGNSATISFSGMAGTVDLRITDALSKTVFSQSSLPANTAKSIDVRNLPAGMYFVTITNDNRQFVRKLIVTR